MKIGDVVKIKKCTPMPEVIGGDGEVVDLQTQESEKYTVYPVWVKMLTGNRKDKVYGFQYDEVAVTTEAGAGKVARTKAVEQIERLLRGTGGADKKTPAEALKVGDAVRIKKCGSMPEVIGETAEIVDLQMQEFEEYTVYPIWVKMLSGERKDKICGFQYDEVEVLTEAHPAEVLRTAVVAQLEEMLKATKVGGVIKIRKCDSMPEVVGETGEIVEAQLQDFDRYAAYPIWVKITSGERKGKVYGFKHDEIALLPQTYAGKTAATKIDEQLREILNSVTTMEEIMEIEKTIEAVKGKVLAESGGGFWEGKTPCWEMFRCPEAIRTECPAFIHRNLPCWEIEGTYSKLHGDGQKGHDIDICRNCRVYKRWSQGEPIEIKLHGQGFNRVTTD